MWYYHIHMRFCPTLTIRSKELSVLHSVALFCLSGRHKRRQQKRITPLLTSLVVPFLFCSSCTCGHFRFGLLVFACFLATSVCNTQSLWCFCFSVVAPW